MFGVNGRASGIYHKAEGLGPDLGCLMGSRTAAF